MKAPHLYKSSLVIRIALATAILLIVYITGMFFNQMKSLGRSVDSMSVSSQRLRELDQILSAITSNEASVRSYLLTRDSLYITKRFVTRTSLELPLRKLEILADQKQSGIDPLKLRKLVDERFHFYDTIIKSEKGNKSDEVVLKNLLTRTDSLTDGVRSYIHESSEDEVYNVNQYRIDHNHDMQTSIITSFLLVTIALFILLVSLNRINSDLNDLKNLNDELQFVNYTFNKAERIAGISHWKYNLRTRHYTFSENFYSLLGVDPETFKPSLESILPHIHPEDREQVIKTYTDSLLNKTPTSLVFRIVDKSGDVKYIRSISSFTENSVGNIVKIGVNYDITEQYLNTVSLEENNKHLKAVNAELESFNNIVSHDLQEPLRKIQMFVSRIEEKELNNLSESGRDYFGRIAQSANRMQNLLIDLVNYSRTMKGEKTFVKTDLKKVVDEVLSELSINIEESDALISVAGLPTIKAIPFQIHQLFVNLIANSLKFTVEGRRPEIQIIGEKVAKGEEYGDVKFDTGKFVKIIVSDNGIGFRQEFAEKIFLLFRRLERDSEYKGTGIGLAICKRIVDNHNGYMFAEGEPGKGSKFIIFLPK